MLPEVRRMCLNSPHPRAKLTASSLQTVQVGGVSPVFAPVLDSAVRSRAGSTASDTSDADKPAPTSADRPSESWTENGVITQQPALAYHTAPSVTSLASSQGDEVDADSVEYIGYIPRAPPVTSSRKRFRVPLKSHALDRTVGNVRLLRAETASDRALTRPPRSRSQSPG